MVKRGYYIHYGARDIVGVSKKIDLQIEELKKMSEVEEISIPLKTKSFLVNMLAILPFVSLAWDYSSAYSKVEDADYLYIRSVAYDYKAIKFLRWIKSKNPNCKVLVEIPTYPCTKEHTRSLQGIVLYPKEWINKRRIRKYIDRYVLTVSGYSYVEGVPAISIRNGVDIDKIKITESKNGSIECFEMIAVAMMQPAHGYERIIEGLKEYYINDRKRKVVLNLVGDGPELSKYKKMVSEYNLDEYVIFSGEKKGQELDQLYARADIALDGLGWYKFGIDKISSLKCAEYMAKGLPVVAGLINGNIEPDVPKFYMRVENSEKKIDILKMLSFYDELKEQYGEDNLRLKIREYSRQYFDISNTFEPVINFLQE